MKQRAENENKIVMRSSNKYIQDMFDWAVEKISQFIMTGKTGPVNRDEFHPEGDGSGEHIYVPSYWAGYRDRTAFYSRDFVHQALGAQIAGYTEENYNMFRIFAGGATEEREWYTPWAFNFDGTPHTIDYKNDQYFVREVPAQFELVEKAYKMYLWSGDKRYLSDPILYRFYTKVLNEFVELHDTNQNGIAEGTGGGTHGEKYSDFASENTWFMPLKMITEPGTRNDEYIDFILENLGEGIGTRPLAPVNLESYTYIPDMLFLYNRNEEAWKWMKYIISRKDLPHERAEQGTNGDYPEIAFTFLSQVVEGMMGIEPEADHGIVATLPRLPRDVGNLLIKNMNAGELFFSVKHERNRKTVLTNDGNRSILWEVRFYGNYKFIKVGDELMKTMQKNMNGETISFVRIEIAPGESGEAGVL